MKKEKAKPKPKTKVKKQPKELKNKNIITKIEMTESETDEQKAPVPEQPKQQAKETENETMKLVLKKLADQEKLIEQLQKSSQSPASGNMADIIKTVADITKPKEDKYEDRLSEQILIDDDDLIIDEVAGKPIGKFFRAEAIGHIIECDKRDGIIRYNPHGLILFRFDGCRKVPDGTGKGELLLNTCKYICHSKKEYEYLKKHSDYGIRFWEYGNKVKPVDRDKMTFFIDAHNMVKEMSRTQLINQCNSFNIDRDSENKERLLTEKIALQLMEESKSKQMNSIMAMNNDGQQ